MTAQSSVPAAGMSMRMSHRRSRTHLRLFSKSHPAHPRLTRGHQPQPPAIGKETVTIDVTIDVHGRLRPFRMGHRSGGSEGVMPQ
jgi:hypothetical protein